MGTRGTCGFIINNKPKLAYNHLDSYPSVLGKNIIDFIKQTNNENKWIMYKNKLPNIIDVVTDDVKLTDDLYEKYKKYLNDRYNNIIDWFYIFENLKGIEWMKEIINLDHYYFSNDFIKYSLYCEWGYIINLDDMTFEFYKGFQYEPQKGNIFGEEKIEGYYPCKLLSKISLDYVNNITYKDLKNVKLLNRKYKIEELPTN